MSGRMILNGFFVELKVREGSKENIQIIAYDKDKSRYPVFYYSDDGSFEKGGDGAASITIQGDVWNWSLPKEEKNGKSYLTRMLMTVSSDQMNQLFEFQYSEDGTKWTKFGEAKVSKIR